MHRVHREQCSLEVWVAVPALFKHDYLIASQGSQPRRHHILGDEFVHPRRQLGAWYTQLQPWVLRTCIVASLGILASTVVLRVVIFSAFQQLSTVGVLRFLSFEGLDGRVPLSHLKLQPGLREGFGRSSVPEPRRKALGCCTQPACERSAACHAGSAAQWTQKAAQKIRKSEGLGPLAAETPRTVWPGRVLCMLGISSSVFPPSHAEVSIDRIRLQCSRNPTQAVELLFCRQSFRSV